MLPKQGIDGRASQLQRDRVTPFRSRRLRVHKPPMTYGNVPKSKTRSP